MQSSGMNMFKNWSIYHQSQVLFINEHNFALFLFHVLKVIQNKRTNQMKTFQQR